VKRRVLCGIWEKGRQCAFTDDTPDRLRLDFDALTIGRLNSFDVNEGHLKPRSGLAPYLRC